MKTSRQSLLAAAAMVCLPVLLGFGSAAAAPECMVPTGPYAPTRPPYTYALDRRSPYGADYFEAYRQGCPRLLETGILTPGHPYFGPMCDLAALREGRPEPSVQEFVEKYRRNRSCAPEAIREARAAGARWVITYICMMTTGGDPAKRTGFWRFYDNWAAFEEFSLPDKPRDDPETWQQRQPDGSPVIAYRRAHPPYRPMFRWTNCINNPNWRTYQRWVTEEAARVGVDGFFVDNAGTLRCCCKHCQAKFGEWLRARYTAPELTELFGGYFIMSPEAEQNSDLRQAEVELFRQESIHNFLADVRKWGSAIRGSFFVFPNGLHRRGYHIATRFRDCDLGMYENSTDDRGGNPGVVRAHVIAGLHVKHVNEHLLAFKYAAGVGARCRANMFSYPGHPKADLANLGANANAYALGIAEPAAFGAGGCYAPTRSQPWFGPVRETYDAFFEANVELYAGKYPFGQVGVVGFVLPNYFGDRMTYGGTGQALRLLMGARILADVITERVFTPEWIARWPALVLPYCPLVSDRQIEALAGYARAGGRLVLLGKDVAKRDRFGRERNVERRQELLTAATGSYETDLSEALEPGGPLAGLSLCPDPASRLVRFGAYVDNPEKPTELILHCVNYDVDLGVGRGRVGVVSDLALAVPLPPGARAASAVLKAPGQADLELTVANADGRALLTLPRLRVYGVVRLALTGKDGP